MKLTKKAFRELLNARWPNTEKPHRNYRFHQRTRAYGDYLYSQDKDMFDMHYEEWVKLGGDFQKWLSTNGS